MTLIPLPINLVNAIIMKRTVTYAIDRNGNKGSSMMEGMCQLSVSKLPRLKIQTLFKMLIVLLICSQT